MVETVDRLVAEEREPAAQHDLLLAGALRVSQGGTRDGEWTLSLILDSYLLRAMAIAATRRPSWTARVRLEGPHRALLPLPLAAWSASPCRPAGSSPG